MKNLNLKTLCASIIGGRVIPIIGNDILNFNISDRIAEAYDSDLFKQVQTDSSQNPKEILNTVFHKSDKPKRNSAFNTLAKNEIRSQESAITFNDSNFTPFEQLAGIKSFSLYVNATFLNTLRIALNLRRPGVKDEFSYYATKNHDLPILDMVRVNDGNPIFELLDRPTIYNLMGSTDYNSPMVLTDTDYVELFVAMFKTSEKFENLQTILKKYDLLFIGCNFPEWALRMFLRFCRGEKLGKEKEDTNYLVEEIVEDPGKIYLLTNYELNYSSTRPAAFVKDIYSEIKRISNGKAIQDKIYENHVFISYDSVDINVARKINRQLVDFDIKTWFDETTLSNGVELGTTIHDAMKRSAVILTILTENTHKNSDEIKYYRKEWNQAIMDDSSKVYSIRTSGYTSQALFSKYFTQEVKDTLLRDDGNTVQRRTIASGDEYKISEEFLNDIYKVVRNKLVITQ